MKPYLPPLKPIPEGASEEVRKQMYEEYVVELRRLNPSHFNPDGSVKEINPVVPFLIIIGILFVPVVLFIVYVL